MNDLGWTLGWLAVQVAILLLPAIGLHALANRRGPASGAWVATMALGMVVTLPILAWLPDLGRGVGQTEPAASRPPIDGVAGSTTLEDREVAENVGRVGPAADRGQSLQGFRLVWSRLERQAVGPVARFRTWGKLVAIVALAGSGVGLLRLLVGLWAVGLCRSRERVVDDPGMVELVEELRRAMGCDPIVELREVPDLTTPATAGWFRPMLLLPRDWRGWDESERRAVVAHELAHVVRSDYASGLLSRVAVVLNFYHPMVRWMAARLQLEQELAADALGARFAGGRSSYLLALSRLALEQDGRSRTWPARAFLPARGTLIRRIAMLKDESLVIGKTWSKASRLATALGLVALTIGVASWKTPAGAADDKPSAPTTADPKAKAVEVGGLQPFEVKYIPEGLLGVVAFRPSATLARAGLAQLTPRLRGMIDQYYSLLAKECEVDASKPGFVKLHTDEIESVILTFDIDSQQRNGRNSKLGDRKLYSLEILESGGVTIRTDAPFDWLTFLRQWKLVLEEVREPKGVYYRIKAEAFYAAGLHLGLYLPDDRTIVYEKEEVIRGLIAREVPTAPAYLRGSEWERVGRDLVAFAMDTKDDGFAKRLNLGRPEDAPALAFFKGVDRLVLGVADLDAISLRGEVITRDSAAAEAFERSSQMYATIGIAQLANAPGEAKEFEPLVRLARGFLSRLKVAHQGRSVTASAEAFGTFSELGSFAREMVEVGGFGIKPQASKAKEAKAEKR